MTVLDPKTSECVWNADENRWDEVKRIIGGTRVTLGPQASDQWANAPEHLAMVLARYRAAAALIGDARTVLEVGCGEGIGAGILARGRDWYQGIDTDAEAIGVAQQTQGDWRRFRIEDVLDVPVPMHDDPLGTIPHAIVLLDVIEHIPTEHEGALMDGIISRLWRHGVCVIGTPSASFDHLASPQSKAGHINTYTHDRLRDLMRRYFHRVQMFGMQDTALHFGHPDARHYHLAVGIAPR